MSKYFKQNYPNNPNEQIKVASNYLRGTLEQSLADPITGAIASDDQQVIKFHGLYQQDDRDQRQQKHVHDGQAVIDLGAHRKGLGVARRDGHRLLAASDRGGDIERRGRA